MIFRKDSQQKYYLVVDKGPDKGRTFAIDSTVVIGREEEADIVLNDTQVSRKHLRVMIKGESILIKDLGSSNGTFIEGETISEASIKLGMPVHVGQTYFRIVREGQQAEVPGKTSTEHVILTSDETIPDESLTMIHYAQPAEEKAYKKSRLIKLLSLSNRIYATLDLQSILNVLMDSIFEIFPSTEKTVLLLAEQEGSLIPAAYRIKDGEQGHIKLSQTILEKAREKKSAILSSNVMTDSDFKFSESVLLDKITSFMCAPMYIKDTLVGIFYVHTTKIDGCFMEEDLRFFLMICNQIAMSVYNAKLYSELRDMAQYNTNILASISSGIIVIDNEGLIKTCNRASEDIFHIRREDVIGKRIADIPRLQMLEKAIDQPAGSDGSLDRVEVSFLDEQEDQKRTIGLGKSFLKDHNQNIKGLIVFFTDLTEINKLNELLQRSERLAALGEMAAGVAHEIRNPLNSIRGFSQLFNENMVSEDKTKEFSEIIIKEVDRLNGLVVDLLDFSREQNISKREMDIRPLIDLTISYVKQGRPELEAQWEKDFPDASATVGIDPDKVKQVLINIYQNALDAMQEKSDIRIKTSLLYSTDPEKMLVIHIEDNGPGMPEKVLEKIFNPFYSTKSRGSGLGLSICQRIIEEHGGYIAVESAEGKGTIFRIHLPVDI